MALVFPKPPKQNASQIEWEQWFEKLYLRLRLFLLTGHETSGDSNSTISANVSYHGVTALTTGRTKTLPAASDLTDGHVLIVQDESGSAGSNNITISRAGTDTINGSTSVSISTNYGRATLIKRGSGKYFSA